MTKSTPQSQFSKKQPMPPISHYTARPNKRLMKDSANWPVQYQPSEPPTRLSFGYPASEIIVPGTSEFPWPVSDGVLSGDCSMFKGPKFDKLDLEKKPWLHPTNLRKVYGIRVATEEEAELVLKEEDRGKCAQNFLVVVPGLRVCHAKYKSKSPPNEMIRFAMFHKVVFENSGELKLGSCIDDACRNLKCDIKGYRLLPIPPTDQNSACLHPRTAMPLGMPHPVDPRYRLGKGSTDDDEMGDDVLTSDDSDRGPESSSDWDSDCSSKQDSDAPVEEDGSREKAGEEDDAEAVHVPRRSKRGRQFNSPEDPPATAKRPRSVPPALATPSAKETKPNTVELPVKGKAPIKPAAPVVWAARNSSPPKGASTKSKDPVSTDKSPEKSKTVNSSPPISKDPETPIAPPKSAATQPPSAQTVSRPSSASTMLTTLFPKECVTDKERIRYLHDLKLELARLRKMSAVNKAASDRDSRILEIIREEKDALEERLARTLASNSEAARVRLQADLQRSHGELAKAKDKIIEERREFVKLENEMASARKRITELEDVNRDLSNRKEAFIAELHETRASWEAKWREREDTISNLQAQLQAVANSKASEIPLPSTSSGHPIPPPFAASHPAPSDPAVDSPIKGGGLSPEREGGLLSDDEEDPLSRYMFL